MLNLPVWVLRYLPSPLSGIVILTIIIFGYLWLKGHDNKIRQTERASCNAEWNQKELDRQAEIDKANDAANKRKKAIRDNAPASRAALINILRQGQFSSRPVN